MVRSDGSPMYNFVVVVDDADMGITHVIRGEDHISNTPKQVLLYQACEFDVPLFAHLSLILGPHGNRLSKRDAATAVIDYQRAGFLAEALCNYLVRLGWSHGDQEIFTKDELIRYFSLDGVGKKGAVFDINKLEWMNSIYIRQASSHDLLRLILRDCDPGFQACLSWLSDEHLCSYIALFQDRSKTLGELMGHIKALALGPTPEELAALKEYPLFIEEYADALVQACKDVDMLTVTSSEMVVKELCQRFKVKLPELALPLRIALLGKPTSPNLYAVLTTLGRDEVIKRLQAVFLINPHES